MSITLARPQNRGLQSVAATELNAYDISNKYSTSHIEDFEQQIHNKRILLKSTSFMRIKFWKHPKMSKEQRP
jgi:hypothetical protein